MHLSHARYAKHAEQFLHFKLRTRLFHRFTCSTFCVGFIQLHEACWQRPFTLARLYIAFAKQHPPLPNRQCTHHHQRVFVMHGVAYRANGACFGVAVIRNAVADGLAAFFAKFDKASLMHTNTSVIVNLAPP